MAHKKAGGSTRNGRDSESKRLGLKKSGGQAVIPGNIIVRQRGTKYRTGENVGLGRDHTIFATAEGRVAFTRKADDRVYVSVVTEYGTVGGGCKPLYDGGQGRLAVKTLLERYPGLLKRGRNDAEVQLKRTCGGKA